MSKDRDIIVIGGGGSGGGGGGKLAGVVLLAGAAGYAVWQFILNKHTVTDLVATYDGQQAGSSVAKAAGDPTTIAISFNYKGPGGELDIGVGLGSAGAVQSWLFKTTTIEASLISVEPRTVTLVTAIPAGTVSGIKDCLKFVQAKGGVKKVDGTFIKSGWDASCYNISGGPPSEEAAAGDMEIGYVLL